MDRSLVLKRILVVEKSQSGWHSASSKVVELKILEISPSGKYVKVQDLDGRKYWKADCDIVPIEVLEEKSKRLEF